MSLPEAEALEIRTIADRGDQPQRGTGRHWIVRGVIGQPLGIAGVLILSVIVLSAALAPVLAPYPPNAPSFQDNLAGVSWHHLMGADDLGRDVLSRVLFGGRIALLLAVGAVGAGAIVGTAFGLVAGYVTGWFDVLTSRLWDVVFAFPGILIGLLIVTVRGAGLTSVVLAVGVANVPVFARLARASTLRERELDYVVSAQTLGASSQRILFRHILPNCLGPLVVQFSISAGAGVLLGAALSFVGLGVQPPTAEWGNMLSESRDYMSVDPWLAVFPGLALMLLVVSLIFIADALNGAMGRGQRG